MKRYHVMFRLKNGNYYSYFIKAMDDDSALIQAHSRMCKCEVTSINEIMVNRN